MIGWAGRWKRTPSALPLSSKKYEMLVFGLCSTFDDWPGWSMDLNPIHHPSPAKKMEMLIFGLHSTTDDRTRLVDGLKPHLQHPSPAKHTLNPCIFGLCSTSDDWPGWSMWAWTPSTTLLQPEIWNGCFWIMFNFWWLAGLVWWTWTPSTTLLQPKNIEMLVFELCSTSDD